MNCLLCQSEDTALYARVPQKSAAGIDYFECRNCALVFMDKAARLTEADEKSFYQLHQNDAENTGYIRLLNQLLRPLKIYLPAGAHVIDYGCGPGPTLAKLLEADGHSVVNYDKYFYPDQKLLQPGLYDCLTATEVIEHFADPAEQFFSMLELLRPGGLLAVMTQVLPADQSFTDWYYRRDPTHVAFYSEKTFRHIAEYFQLQMLYGRAGVRIFQKGVADTQTA